MFLQRLNVSEKLLSADEIAALLACYYACDGSTKAHQPLELIRKKFSPPFRDEAKRALEKLARRPERYILPHRGRTTSYSITIAGIRKLEELGLIPSRR